MLRPTVVGEIACGALDLAGLDDQDQRALIRHDLAFPAVQAATGEVPSRLAEVARRKAERSMAVAAIATDLARALSVAGVPSLALKGPALAVQTTGSWLGRGSTDVDVLVDEGDLPAAHAALLARGCRSRAGHPGSPTPWQRYVRGERAYVGLPVTVDLHWRLDAAPGSFDLPFRRLWAVREEVGCDGLEVTAPGRVDALLVTAVHGAKEHWARWCWALDAVRQVVAVPAGEWATVRERAREAGAGRALALCVAVAHACGGGVATEVDPDARRRADDLLAASAMAQPVDWSRSASWARRRDRWAAADRPTTAIDGLVRAGARLLADRRAPGQPQRRRG
jgi:hypothetical protein